MNWLEALIAGVIQGLTEFLPISSSGHLVIYSALTGETDGGDLTFNIFLHLATLLAVIILFRKDVWLLIRELVGAIADIIRGKPNFKTEGRRFLLLVIIATIPAVIAGGGIKILDLDYVLENIFVVAVMLIVTAVFMFLVDRIDVGKLTRKNTPYSKALGIGLFQAAAILPGLSRSGTTIFAGTLLGLRKEFAVKFAFILSIPAIAGSAILEIRELTNSASAAANPASWIIGFIAAFVCGFFAILFVRVLIKSKKFYIFGIYCLAASVFAFLVGFGVIHA